MWVELQYPVFDPPQGGVENYVLELAAALDRLGHRVGVFAGPSRRRAPPAEEASLEVRRHPDLKPRGLQVLLRPRVELAALTEAMAARDPAPDLVLARHPSYALASRRALPATTRVVYVPAEDMAFRARREGLAQPAWRWPLNRWLEHLWSGLEAEAARAADAVVTLSQNMADQVRARVRREVRVHPPGVNEARFAPDPAARQATRAELGLGDDDVLLVTLSRLSPEKNLLAGLEALARLPARVRWVVLGGGDLRAELEGRVGELGLADRVTLAGLVSDPERWLKAGDVLFHPAWAEPFGHVLLEGMAAALPVAAAGRCQGRYRVATEEAVPEAARVLFDPSDPVGMAAALQGLVDDPAARRARGQAGRDFVLAERLWDHHAAALLAAAEEAA